MTAPLLLTGRNAPNVKTMTITVPAGHVLPDGHTVKDPFKLVVEAGARWHPDWNGPRYSVIAYRVMAMGDALAFTGDRAAAFPLPDWVADLAPVHGLPAGAGCEIGVKEGGPRGQLYAPFKPESIFAFVPPHHKH